ncbi:DNRLRE domain-containing protein [Streptomyces sp. CHA1]|uniref:LamG-like jellyroll fold domain-containing protein n=1 Tax=Streptomyces TaxID=1883 RepID=UPI001876C177|nr:MULTISPECIES: LamG-like jellyroll fold domain-containing protein [Streptomyces]WSB24396.1 DNRLRE domain-containing protein [Streptomyces albidoflavus]MBT3156830.1 LamG domain-containing protein [Streptomyces sp. G11C]MCO6700076.1 DNRLRE domain-containing protein [Streptomyces sp. CHB9.2]MCO6706224.1 DNRLRE domain-containing protein [Streptomyces sp. CHA3]MCO6711961.1 DNRLRE domain-containing protein [Streptomyces sp. CHB19.2]
MRSESADVFAQPDGSLEAREYLRPVRTRVGDEWKSVDTELVRTTDGGVAPKAVTNRTVFSGGGDGPMVRLSKAGRELSFDWPGKLPEPTLSGDTATYADVLPDVDLRLTASADGYQSLVVVKTPEAAQDERLAKLRLGLDATGLDVSETEAGGLAATDAGSGGTVFEAATPVMWDSSEGPQEGSPSSRAATSEAPPERGEPGAGDSGRLAPVGVEVGSDGEELLLTPDAEVLKGEETVYPVFIDPQWYSPRASAWTMASKYWSGSPQWKFNGKKDEGLGYCGWDYCAPHDTKRLFYRIPVSKFAGKSILSAEFVVRNTWSASCDKRSVELWQTKDISSSTTWNSQNASGFWTKQLASESFAHGHTNCSAKDAEFNVKSAVQSAANAKNSTMTFGLRAGSESDKYGWKRFSDKAFLRVKYNRPPPQVKMSQLAMEYGGSCKKPASAARVRTLGKIYANNITDPDGDPISVQFQAKWDAGDGKGLVARWSPARTTAKKSGSNFTVSLPSSIPVNKQIHWYVRSYDGAQYSPWSHAGDATGCYFVYDTSVPKAPSITSPEYPASDSENPEDAPYDGVGQYGSFTVKAADSDVVKYWYGVNMDPSSKNTLTTSKGAAQVAKVLPAEPGTHFFTAVAFDAAGNMSEPRTHLYRVKGGQPERATWQLDEAQGAGAGEGSTPDRLLTVHGEPEYGAEGAKGSAISLDGSDDYAQSDISVVDTDRGFTVSAWVKLSKTPSGTATVAMQPGNNRPGFELYYSSAYERWIFNQYESDSQDAKIIRAMAPQAGGVKVGEWQHLVGSYNGSERFIELYVDGQQVGQADLPSAWNARRGLVLGAASHNGKVGNFLPGAIDEVQIFDKRITANEVAKLARHERVGDPGRPATAVFEMEDTADSVATAKGLRGHGGVLPADYHGGVTTGAEGVAGKAARFNGTDAYGKVGKISGPHVNTSRSFAVMAWAKMDKTKPSKAAIIAAQAGRERPGFELYYSQTYDRWAFNQYSADSADAKVIRAMQPDNQKAASDTWVHLAGVHDVVVGTLTLYVNGVKAGTTPLDGAFYADQSMFIGAGQYGSAVGNHFPGSIDDVRLFDRPVSAEEVQQVFKQRPVVKARWKFEETSGTAPVTTPDDTGSGNALTLGGDAAITSDDFYIDEGALVLNGATAHAVTNRAPVDSSASFTVATWVKASALTDKPLSLFQLEGTKTSAFGVRFLPDSRGADVGPGRWELTVTETDDAEAAHVSATHGNFSDAREWTHITVAYDGFNRSVRLYVDGLLDETVCQDDDGDGSADDSTCTETVPWAENALTFEAKSLSVGRPSASGTDQYFPGVIDDLWVFQSSLSERQVEQLAGSWFDVPTEVPQG